MHHPGPGGLYAATHHASVRTICGDHAPPVYSRGEHFLNFDRWLDKALMVEMMDWAREHPGETPTEADIWAWVMAANVSPIPTRMILIASTPKQLDWTAARARTGGAYHEGLHTLYSRRHRLLVSEVADMVWELWELADWSKVGHFVQEIQGYVEDVRIENRGNDRFPGIYPSMCDLQDFVLLMEEDGLRDARAHFKMTLDAIQQHNASLTTGQTPKQVPEEPEHWTEMSTMLCALRDLGLGYTHTTQAQRSIERYQETHPEVYAAVESGFLSPFVEEASALRADDGLGALWLSMKITAAIMAMAGEDEAEEQEVAKRLSERILEGPGPTPGILDGNGALMLSVSIEYQEATADLPEGEQPWRPYNPSADILVKVGEGNPIDPDEGPMDPSEMATRAEVLLGEVYADVSYLRARLHQILRVAAFTDIEHGARRGTRLSGRELVNTKIALMMGDKPDGPFITAGEEIDTSVAAAIVIDESSSMESWLDVATRILLTLTEPLSSMRSSLGTPFPVFACGFRHMPMDWSEVTALYEQAPAKWEEQFHRVIPVVYDVFKDFDEPLETVLWRFAGTRAMGGTPMGDGIQLGLEKLRTRGEGHRLLFVVTDGMPTGQHARVVRHQIRNARDEGIYIIGVGIGGGSRSVMDLFDDHVWTQSVEQLPEALIWKLNDLLDFRRFQMVG